MKKQRSASELIAIHEEGRTKERVPTMQIRREKENRSNWQFTMEQIGRELRKLYPSTDAPPGLHALFTEQRSAGESDAPKSGAAEHNGERDRD
jgi:hypothetical protein